MKSIQNKIISIVNKYIKTHYEEYSDVCNQLKDKKELQKNKFASTGRESFINQLATEIPETLDNLIQYGLSEEEWLYYKSKKGTLWFAKRFPEFSPAQKI